MTVRLSCLLALLCSALVAALPAGPAHAADEHVIAVLYFDNNTGDQSLDVLKKGLADMMITDLSAVDGITVVERDRLEELLREVDLQKGRYFDNATAIKLGKGLGARYAVTGALHARKPKLRIDVRMIDIATAKVVATAQVTGAESELFELEQNLVAKFVTAMRLRFTPPTRPLTRVPDLKTLLDYSKGIDLADKGLYEDASKTMSSVVQRAPTFALARARRDQLIARLAAAGERRQEIISDRGAALAQSTEEYLGKHRIDGLTAEEARTYLAYRVLRGRFIARALATHLSKGSPHIIQAGHEADARKLMRAYYANGELLLRELAVYAAAHTQTYPNGVTYLDQSFALPAADGARARDAGLVASLGNEVSEPRRMLAEFLLLGYVEDGSGSRMTIAPPLAELEPKFARLGYQLLEQAFAEAHAKSAREPVQQSVAIRALATHAEALLLREQREQGIAKLQEILDRYPTAHEFKHIERRIQRELGLEHDPDLQALERYASGLKACDDMDLRVGLGAVLPRRMRLAGLAAVQRTVAEVEKHCKKNPGARQFWSYLYIQAALAGAAHDDCKLFDQYVQRYLDAGGSPGDAQGYRKNYSRCPAPGAP